MVSENLIVLYINDAAPRGKLIESKMPEIVHFGKFDKVNICWWWSACAAAHREEKKLKGISQEGRWNIFLQAIVILFSPLTLFVTGKMLSSISLYGDFSFSMEVIRACNPSGSTTTAHGLPLQVNWLLAPILRQETRTEASLLFRRKHIIIKTSSKN